MPIKGGVSVLNHDTGFRNIKNDLVRRYGKEAAERIWEKAESHLELLFRKYAHLPKAVKVHTEGNMFRNAAVYMAIKEEYPADAIEILESGVEKEGKRVANLLSALLRILGMKRVMLVVFAKMPDSFFGEEAEFQSTKHYISKEEVRFDINQCPYCKHLTKIADRRSFVSPARWMSGSTAICQDWSFTVPARSEQALTNVISG